ncbi:MAG: tetratricopeptide repeat protein [Proteobacteria bacterium]|nr:tetratricopeptide repeat protein [Pseudomonadota bacterium]
MRRFLLAFAGVCCLSMAATVMADQGDLRLNPLFDRLQSVDLSQAQAREIEFNIWQIWGAIDDSRVQELLANGTQAMATGSFEQALVSFNMAVELAPGMSEAWNKRATLHYLMGNYEESIYDIQQTLALEPRHFGALSGLGLVYLGMKREEEALHAFEKALEVNPHMPGPKSYVRKLTEKLKGIGA